MSPRCLSRSFFSRGTQYIGVYKEVEWRKPKYPCPSGVQMRGTMNFEFMIYHRNYTHNLSSCQIKA